MENENDLKKIMRSHSERVSKMKLPIVLGIDSKNKPKIVDLAKVGNILVGGENLHDRLPQNPFSIGVYPCSPIRGSER